MTGRIGEEKLQEIRERIDMVELVSSYLPLKRSGANHVGLCPFHNEKTASFNVSAARQMFHCFGCEAGGDAFSFLMRMEGLSFLEAVHRLAERAGVLIEEQPRSPAEERQIQERETLLRLSQAVADFYHRHLLDGEEGAAARRYLRRRGYQGETVRQFGLGYAPDRWRVLGSYLTEQGFDSRLAREVLGLIRPGNDGLPDYDLFRGRLIFPVQDSRGRVVAFGGRVLDKGLPKYINSPESPIYHKSKVLYGLYQAREAMRCSGTGIVVEGYFDQLALYRAGFRNVVATCGTALTVDQAQLLKRHCNKLLLFFDQDEAGRKATFRAMEVVLAEGFSVAVVEPDCEGDPDSFLSSHSAEALQHCLDAARPVLQVFLDDCLARHGDSIEGRARAAEELIGMLVLLPNDLERDLYLKELARQTGIDPALLQRKLAAKTGAAGSATPRSASSLSTVRRRPELLPTSPGSEDKIQEWLLQLMKSSGEIRRRVAEATPEALFEDDNRRAVAIALLASCDGEGGLDEDRLLNALSETQKELLSGIIVKDDPALVEDVSRIFEDCRRALERERLRERYRQLQSRIAEAERAGDGVALAALQRESLDISKRIRQRR